MITDKNKMQPVTFMDTERLEKLERAILDMKNLFIEMFNNLSLEDRLMTSKEVQEYIQMGSTWVDANKHKIGCSRIGGEWRFRKSTVDEFVNKLTIKMGRYYLTAGLIID